MEIEFNGVTEEELRSICNNLGLETEVLALNRRQTICPDEEVQEFGDGESYYLLEESCWHGYYFCGDVRCGRTPTYRPSDGSVRTGRTTRKARGRTSSSTNCSNVDCSGTTNCDASSDSLGAILIFLAIVALVLFIIWVLPILIPVFIGLANLGLALMLGLFNIITFGVLRKKFKRVLVYLPKDPDRETLERLIAEVAVFGGLPRRFIPPFKRGYYTNGFWLLRTGAYLFIPALAGTILVLWIQPESNFVLFAPILSFTFSILLIVLGDLLINRKARQVSRAP
ncbi:MAG: hypothetical protein ACTSR2_08260 [Candidatus Hodarchaeales archaeon]